MTTIAVGVINYNTRELLKRCITAVREDSPDEFYVVDNASSDGSALVVASQFPEITLFANRHNAGFGAGANQVVNATGADYVLILNSDAIPEPGAIRALAAYLDMHSQVAIAGPRLVDVDGRTQSSCRQFPGTFSWVVDNAITAKIFGLLPGVAQWSLRSGVAGSGRVPWVIGAAVVLRTSAVKRLGGFDERYFMYCEEMDLCLRLTDAGWEIHYVPDAVVNHIGGASTGREKELMRAALNASTVRFYRQHYSGARLGMLLVFARIQAIARAIRAHLRGSEQPNSRKANSDNSRHVTCSDVNDH